eukprot:7379081-Prymnesium_polylepis.1
MSTRARTTSELRMLPTPIVLGTDPEQRRCRPRNPLAGWPPPRLQKAPHSTDVPSMATGHLAASLRLGSIPTSAEPSVACTTRLHLGRLRTKARRPRRRNEPKEADLPVMAPTRHARQTES